MVRGINHIGISVVDLDRSIEFYRSGFGMEIVAQGTFDGEQYARILGLGGAKGVVALLKLGSLQIELFEFSHPAPAAGDPERPVCNHGITHFCIEVTDIQFQYNRLLRIGASFHCPPLAFGAVKATYGRDLDGNVFELLERNEVAESA